MRTFIQRSLCLVLTILVMLSGLPAAAFAQNDAIAINPVETYFSNEAKELFATQDVVDVLLFMPDRSNIDGAIQQMSDIYGTQLDKVQQRAAVVGELQQTARASQYEILGALADAQAIGQVEAYESFFIVNAIRVKGDRETVARLIQTHQVERVYPNGRVELVMPTMDGEAAPASDDEIEWNIKQIQAHLAWDEHQVDGQGIVIGMIDSGVEWDHPALKAKFRGTGADGNLVDDIEAHWFDATNPANKVPVDERNIPHGTHVMGTILGSEPDGTNRIGVAPGAKFIAAKGLGAMGGSSDQLLRAAEWMLQPGGDVANAPDIVNNSWGGPASTDEWFRDVVLRWRQANIFPIFAAGNQNPGEPLPWPGSLSNPANLMEVLSVAATDKYNIRGSFSYLGPSLFDKTGQVPKPDVSAPGVNIRSAVVGGVYQGGWNGTSMAAPAVAGTVALMLQANPNLTLQEIEDALEKTATPLSDQQFPTSPNMGYGYGLINAYDAVSEVSQRGTGVVQGKLLLSERDQQAPEFTMEYPTTHYENRDLPISFHIKDDIVTAQSIFMYRQPGEEEWQEIELMPVSGDVQDGRYQITIPAADVHYPALETKLVITDFGRNVESQMLAIPIIKGIVPGYHNSFEGEMFGWILEEYWNVGTPKNALEPTPVDGTKLLGTNVGSSWPMPHPGLTPPPEEIPPEDDDGGVPDPGLLPLDGEFSAYLPPIDMTQVTAEQAVLTWQQFVKNPESVEAVVEYDTGEDWQELASYKTMADDWNHTTLDLSQFAGQSDSLQLRLRYKIKDEVYARGWYIDNLTLGQTPGTDAVLSATQQAEIDFIDQVIPLQGTVRLVELNRVTQSDLRGDYSLRTSASEAEVTLRAEAYGYFPQERQVVIAKDAVLQEDFVMQPKGRGQLTIQVTDPAGNLVEGVVGRLIEEPQAGISTSDAAGRLTFDNVYEGNYHVRLYKLGYLPTVREVAIYAGDNTTMDVVMDSYSGELVNISYDEYNNWENALAFIPANYGMAMRFTATASGLISKADIYYMEDYRYLGDTVKIGLFKLVNDVLVSTAEPFEYVVEKDKWNEINLESFGMMVEEGEDFYVASIQVAPGHQSPAIGTMWSMNPEALNRSFAVFPDRTLDSFGNNNLWNGLMMKASIRQGEVTGATSAPTLDHPYLQYVKQANQTITGQTSVDGLLTVYVNGTARQTQTVVAGPVSFELQLAPGETEIALTITPQDGVESVKSAPARYVLDQTAPVIAVTSHEDGETVGSEMVELVGTVMDDNLADATINGRQLSLLDGRFAQHVTLSDGENTIEIIARDLAGNSTTYRMSLIYDDAQSSVPEIVLSDMTPAQDLRVQPGDQVTLSVKSRTGLSGRVLLQAPNGLMSLSEGLELIERRLGHYEAQLIVPENVTGTFNVTYELREQQTMASATAPGKLIIADPDQTVPVNKVTRIAGANRYATAVALSQAAYQQADVVLLANGTNPVDGLVAGPLAIALDAPILLSESDSLNSLTRAEIERLQAKQIIIIGGNLAISQAVADDLAKDYDVSRLAGKSRLETSLAVAAKVTEVAPGNTAVLTNQMAFSDVVAMGPVTDRLGSGVAPILLTDKDQLAPETKAFLEQYKPQQLVLVGGKLVLSEQLEDQLSAYGPVRVAGQNRYATALEIARFIDQPIARVALSNGDSPVDAMASAPYLAQNKMVLLLSPADQLPAEVAQFLSPSLKQAVLIGGTKALSETVEIQVRQILEKR